MQHIQVQKYHQHKASGSGNNGEPGADIVLQ